MYMDLGVYSTSDSDFSISNYDQSLCVDGNYVPSLSSSLIRETLDRNKDLVDALDSILIQRAEELLENPDLLFGASRKELEKVSQDLVSIIECENSEKEKRICELERSIFSLEDKLNQISSQVEMILSALNLP